MNVYSAKEKDKLLNSFKGLRDQIRINTSDKDGVLLDGIAKELESLGCIKRFGVLGGATCIITEKGYALKTKGGFAGMEKREKNKSRTKEMKTYIIAATSFVLGVIVTKLVDYIYLLLTGT